MTDWVQTNLSYINTGYQHCATRPSLKKAREAKSYLFGSQKLRDNLRQKCFARMQKSRQLDFQLHRDKMIENDEQTLKEVLRQELADLEHDINLQEKIYQELLGELNEWIVAEQEKEEDYLIDFKENHKMICPFCQKLPLSLVEGKVENEIRNLLTCECGAEFTYSDSLEKLNNVLRSKIEEHEKQCEFSMNFFMEPEVPGTDKHLGSICESCDWMYIF